MSVLCHGDCHVWLGSSSLCACEAEKVAMIYYPANYNPFGPRQPKPDPPADVPITVFKAARDDVKAQWLSADGLRAYKEMSDGIRVFYWDEGSKTFGSSFPCEGLPGDAVKL